MPIRYPIEIATYRATGTVTTVTLDNLSQDYDELLIKVSVRAGNAVTNNDCFLSFSGQSGTDHTQPTRLSGNGSAAAREAFASGASGVRLCQMPGASSTANNFASANVRVPNYKSTGVKPFFTEGGYSTTGQTSYTDTSNAFYASASPITSVRFDAGSGGGFATGSTFTVYGIYKVQSEATPKATGGQVYQDSNYFYHVFKTSGTFVPNQSITADYLVIAGGGGGGARYGAGGGAGGYLTSGGTQGGGGSAGSALSLTAQTYAVVIGAGGPAGVQGINNSSASNGGNSIFSTITATGGGGGAGNGNADAQNAGGDGGSSGGGTYLFGDAGTRTASPVQGYNGGAGPGGFFGGGGGGGAGGAGVLGAGADSCVGGAGLNSVSTWATVTNTGVNGYYAGGGGAYISAGGSGGGGTGGGTGTSGTVNTGSGGGGSTINLLAGNGGSGIVIVRYAR